MGEGWLEIADGEIDAGEVEARVRERMAGRRSEGVMEPEALLALAERLWEEEIGAREGDVAVGGRVRFWEKDCDVVPRDYTIEWRYPIVGPIHALVRRIIDNEIRCYLLPSLERQSRYNRHVLRALEELAQENVRLRQQIEELRADGQDAGTPV
jgi:hypothetical protein